MMGDRSVKVWIVSEYGHEYETPVKVWDDKRRADQHVKRLLETLSERNVQAGFLGYRAKPCDMMQTKG